MWLIARIKTRKDLFRANEIWLLKAHRNFWRSSSLCITSHGCVINNCAICKSSRNSKHELAWEMMSTRSDQQLPFLAIWHAPTVLRLSPTRSHPRASVHPIRDRTNDKRGTSHIASPAHRYEPRSINLRHTFSICLRFFFFFFSSKFSNRVKTGLGFIFDR